MVAQANPNGSLGNIAGGILMNDAAGNDAGPHLFSEAPLGSVGDGMGNLLIVVKHSVFRK